MEYRALGSTGIRVSRLAFGAGPVSGWMAELTRDDQVRVIRRALDAGINWFDTAAGYGEGLSEESLGAAFARLGLSADVHIATKVRFLPEHLGDLRGRARASFEGSLRRLGVRRVTLLQLHNAITERRGDEPTSVTPEDVLGPGGVLEAFDELRGESRVRFLGLTGIGQPGAMRRVVGSGAFATIQVPYNLLNPSAGHAVASTFPEANYGNIIEDCGRQGMGVFVIRVFAGGALAGNPPGAHTLKTPFFPLALYERDRARAAGLRAILGPGRPLTAEAIRFVLAHPHVSAAIVGFREPGQVDEAVTALQAGPLPLVEVQRLARAAEEAAGIAPTEP
jgi:aryl-alcohol dehydrogenase-like predicted oxidoreductase